MPCLGRVRIFRLRTARLIGEYCNYDTDDSPGDFTRIIVGLRSDEDMYGLLCMIAISYFRNDGMFMGLMMKFYNLYFPCGVEELIDRCYFYDPENFKDFGVVIQRSVKCLGCESQVYLPKIRCGNCLS